MSDDKTFKKAVVWSAVTLYTLPVISNAFVDHPCRDIQVDASCREPSDMAPHRTPIGPTYTVPVVTGNSSASTSVSSDILGYPSQFR